MEETFRDSKKWKLLSLFIVLRKEPDKNFQRLKSNLIFFFNSSRSSDFAERLRKGKEAGLSGSSLENTRIQQTWAVSTHPVLWVCWQIHKLRKTPENQLFEQYSCWAYYGLFSEPKIIPNQEETIAIFWSPQSFWRTRYTNPSIGAQNTSLFI